MAINNRQIHNSANAQSPRATHNKSARGVSESEKRQLPPAKNHKSFIERDHTCARGAAMSPSTSTQRSLTTPIKSAQTHNTSKYSTPPPSRQRCAIMGNMTALSGEAAIFIPVYERNSPVAPSDFGRLTSGYRLVQGYHLIGRPLL